MTTAKFLKIEEYVIASEKHEDGSPHLHVYLKLDKTIDIKDPMYWDIYIEILDKEFESVFH